MKRVFWWIAVALSWLLIPLVVRATPISVISAFPTKTDGQVVFAADWNTIGNITTWINTTLLSTTSGLNVINTQGDMYVAGAGGNSLARLAVGTNGQVLTSNGTTPTWGSVANLTTLNTMGDTLYYNGSNQRLPIGTTGQVLTVVAGLPAWSQATNVPIGGIIAWSPAGAGTNTIPTNFALCDGLVHNGITTPNLIGRCILGTQPTGGGATPSAGGYGTTVCDANTVGSSTTHNHGLTTAFQGFASAGGGLPVNLYACQSAIQLDASVSLVYIERVMMINLGGLL